MRKQTKLIVALSATALLAIGASAVAMADGWDNSSGEWQYLNKDGSSVTDVWRKSGDFWFYLGNDGRMVREELIEYKDNYYYVNADGAMVTNTWVPLDVDSNDADDAEYRWYYFGSDGKAYKNSNGTLNTKDIKTINGKKYTFDEDGRMLYGWVSKDLDISSNDDEDWQDEDNYYFGGWNDGSAQTGWVQLTVNVEGISDDDSDGTFWFYFDSNGKKKYNKKMGIDGRTYYFDRYGRMIEDWVDASNSDSDNKFVRLDDDNTMLRSTDSDVIYTNGDGSARKNAWVWAIPSEAQDKSDNEDDEYSWWFAESSGKLKKDGVKKIKGKYYIFDNIGRMKSGLVISFGTNYEHATNNLKDYVGSSSFADRDLTEYTKSDYLALDLDSITKDDDGNDVDWVVDRDTDTPLYCDYYIQFYSNDGEADGSRKTGYQNVEFDDGVYQMYFNTSNGRGESDYLTKIKKFVSRGIVLKANVDDSNYAAVEALTYKNATNSYNLLLSHKDGTECIPDTSYAYQDVMYWNHDLFGFELGDVNNTKDLADMVGSATTGYADDARGYGYFVLVNSSGTIQKNKKNLKDNNDIYYFTNGNGVVCYAGATKLTTSSSKTGVYVLTIDGRDYYYDDK